MIHATSDCNTLRYQSYGNMIDWSESNHQRQM